MNNKCYRISESLIMAQDEQWRPFLRALRKCPRVGLTQPAQGAKGGLKVVAQPASSERVVANRCVFLHKTPVTSLPVPDNWSARCKPIVKRKETVQKSCEKVAVNNKLVAACDSVVRPCPPVNCVKSCQHAVKLDELLVPVKLDTVVPQICCCIGKRKYTFKNKVPVCKVCLLPFSLFNNKKETDLVSNNEQPLTPAVAQGQSPCVSNNPVSELVPEGFYDVSVDSSEESESDDETELPEFSRYDFVQTWWSKAILLWSFLFRWFIPIVLIMLVFFYYGLCAILLAIFFLWALFRCCSSEEHNCKDCTLTTSTLVQTSLQVVVTMVVVLVLFGLIYLQMFEWSVFQYTGLYLAIMYMTFLIQPTNTRSLCLKCAIRCECNTHNANCDLVSHLFLAMSFVIKDQNKLRDVRMRAESWYRQHYPDVRDLDKCAEIYKAMRVVMALSDQEVIWLRLIKPYLPEIMLGARFSKFGELPEGGTLPQN